VGLAAAVGAKALVPTEREIVAVADRAYASLKLLERCRKLCDPITFTSLACAWMLPSTNRLRHDAPIR
jgi:hypothetical protein